MEDAIDKTQADLTTALETFERGRATLYRPDGGPKYAETTHAELLATLTATLHGVAQRVDAAVAAELAAVRRAEEAEHDDPVSYLTPAELATANARAGFVREDSERLPLPQLLTRLRGVLAAGVNGPDKPTALVWGRYAGQRIASVAETAHAGGGRLDGATRDQLEAIETEVGKLTAIIAPASGITKAEAARRMKRARDARSATLARVHEADGTRERMLAQMAARYGGF